MFRVFQALRMMSGQFDGVNGGTSGNRFGIRFRSDSFSSDAFNWCGPILLEVVELVAIDWFSDLTLVGAFDVAVLLVFRAKVSTTWGSSGPMVNKEPIAKKRIATADFMMRN